MKLNIIQVYIIVLVYMKKILKMLNFFNYKFYILFHRKDIDMTELILQIIISILGSIAANLILDIINELIKD